MGFFDLIPGFLPDPFAPEIVQTPVNTAGNTEHILDSPRAGKYSRQMMRWKVPAFGWVNMFINPEQLQIREAKDITSVRTKAGFVVQYAGEKLTEITLSGTTGSAGMEGINVLRSLYRAEQIGFDDIAEELQRTSNIAEIVQLSRGITSIGSLFPQLGQIAGSAADLALNVSTQPFPTLASLAVNVEMYFQGETYRGYFTEFSVTESGDSPGIFEYSLGYTAYARRGVRRNFMPWHRQPFAAIGGESNSANPLSFNLQSGRPNAHFSYLPPSESGTFTNPGRNSEEVFGNRSIGSGGDGSGGGLGGIDLRG